MDDPIPTLTERHLNVFVLDRNDRAIPGARVVLSIGDADVAWGETRGTAAAPLRIHAQAGLSQVTLRAEYVHHGDVLSSTPVAVDLDQGNFTIRFSEVEMPGEVPKWFAVAGYASGAATLLFFMYVALSGDGRANQASVIVMALGLALAFSFIGGQAAADGRIPFFKNSPVAFSVGGGVAVFVIALLLGQKLFLEEEPQAPVNTRAVSIGFAQDVEFGRIIEILEDDYNVTIAIGTSCGPDLRKAVVAAGKHAGTDPKEFLELIQLRFRTEVPKFKVADAGGIRYEIA